MHGYVDKNRQSLEMLRHAIDEVIQGRVFFAEVVQQVRQRLRHGATGLPEGIEQTRATAAGAVGWRPD